MKKTLVVFIATAMLLAVCLPLAACNAAEREKPAQEIFYEKADIALLDGVYKTVGIDSSKNSIFTLRDDKKDYPSYSFNVGVGLSDVSVGGQKLLDGEASLNAKGLLDISSSTFSGKLDYAYLTDALSVDFASGSDKIYLKVTDVFEKYLAKDFDLSELLGKLPVTGLPEVSGTSDITSFDPELLVNTVMDIINSHIDKEKLVEAKEAVKAGKAEKEVRSVSFTLTGSAINDFYTSLVADILGNETVKAQLGAVSSSLIDSIKDELPEKLTVADTDTLTLKKYYDVNSFVGLAVDINAENGKLSASLIMLTADSVDYADVAFNIDAEDEKHTAAAAFSNNGTDMKLDISVDPDDTESAVKITVTSKTTAADGAKTTAVSVKLTSQSVTVEVPVTVTVNESSDKKFSGSVSLGINIPNTIAATVKLSITVEETAEKPAIPQDSEVYTAEEEEALNSDAEKMQAVKDKISNTVALINSMMPDDSADTDYSVE